MKLGRVAGCAVCLGLWVSTVRAEEFDGIEFPAGSLSFADRVVSFDLKDGEDVEAPYDDPETALGPPDYVNNSTPNFVSLGNVPSGGQPSELVLEFVDNRLVDVPGDDLYVFEVGSAAEPTEVAISNDGDTWFELGRIEGSTRAVDLADFSEVPAGMLFRFVLLRDVTGGGASGAPYGGPDIDAIGAIGSDVSDADEDSVHDAGDNCHDVANTDQADGDTDQVGDVCDSCPTEPGAAPDDGCPPEGSGAGGEGGDDAAAGAGGAGGDDELVTGSGGSAGGSDGDAVSAGGAAATNSASSSATSAGGVSTHSGASGGSGGVSATSSTVSGGEASDDAESEASCQCRLGTTRSGSAHPFGLALLGLSTVLWRRRRGPTGA